MPRSIDRCPAIVLVPLPYSPYSIFLNSSFGTTGVWVGKFSGIIQFILGKRFTSEFWENLAGNPLQVLGAYFPPAEDESHLVEGTLNPDLGNGVDYLVSVRQIERVNHPANNDFFLQFVDSLHEGPLLVLTILGIVLFDNGCALLLYQAQWPECHW